MIADLGEIEESVRIDRGLKVTRMQEEEDWSRPIHNFYIFESD